MSRSRKKNPVVKDKGHMLDLYNKRFRRINKQRIAHSKEPFLMKEIVNDWDVCDYKFTFFTKSDKESCLWHEKYMRK